jgi:hypothetical protein
MANGDVDLNFLARQIERLLANDARQRDEMVVLTAMVTRLESAQPTILEQMRTLGSQIGRLNDRLGKLETDGMSPQQVDAIANALQPRLLDALINVIHDKLFARIDARFGDIQGQLKELRELYGQFGGEPF